MPTKSMRGFLTLLVMLIFVSRISYGKNLGVWGHIYPIAEEDFTHYIYQRLDKLKQSGALKEMKANFIKRVKSHILRPNPVEGLTTTNNPKIYYYDPTFIVTRDIRDQKGELIAAKGTKINPLKKAGFKFNEILLFFNADDKRELKWAKKEAGIYKDKLIKYILVKGNIKKAGDALNNRVYFDQYGFLTQKLGIKHIPCLVRQKGSLLEIREYSVSDEGDS